MGIIWNWIDVPHDNDRELKFRLASGLLHRECKATENLNDIVKERLRAAKIANGT
jgi:hypothetical protein